MEEEYKKVVRDPIYGYIGITKDQLRVISLPIFQRLRRISQLSFTDFVYPNATHTRFSHSLGVMELARRTVKHLKTLSLDLDDKYYDALEWAGLLHDIGHFPFSHVFEQVAEKYIEKKEKPTKNFHVRWGISIIDNAEYGITRIISDDVLQIVKLLISEEDRLSGSQKLLKSIMTWIFSIDRLDYLRRDAYHAGTPEYSIIDTDRILSSILNYDKDRTISVYRKNACFALEGAILSYFLMYRAIYYHKTVRSAYLLFQEILRNAFESPDVFKDVEWDKPDFWLSFDDHDCLTRLRHSESPSVSNLMEKFLTRDFPKVIEQTEIPSNVVHRVFLICQDYDKKVSVEQSLLRKLRSKWEELDMILLDSPFLSPYPTIQEIYYPYLWDENPDKNADELQNYAPYLKHLSEASEKARIYVNRFWKPEEESKKRDFIIDLNSEISSLE